MSLTSSISSTATVAASLSSLSMVTPSLTTTFTPTATTCTEHKLTMLENRAWEIWMNMPVPVPGTTFTDCYPSQYVTSLLLSAGGVTQPAFQPLVCPQDYTTIGPYTSNYIACCPSLYLLHPAETTLFSDRPAFGGTCYSPLYGSPTVVTMYGASGVTATSVYTATATNAQAFAYPIEGFAYGVAEVGSLSSSAATQTGVASSSPVATGASSSTHTVLANAQSTFSPSSVSANVGDSIVFRFESGNHSITQSTFDSPCVTLEGGFDSGYEPDTGNFTIGVTSTASQWFYSKQGSECEDGMLFALNPSTSQTFASFYKNALSTSTKSTSNSGVSTGVKAGAAIGSIAGVALIIAAVFFFFRRRNKNNKIEGANAEDGHQYDPALMQENNQGGAWAPQEESEPKPTPASQNVELHDRSTPGELDNQSPAVELHGANQYAPVEMWAPDHEIGPVHQPPSYDHYPVEKR